MSKVFDIGIKKLGILLLPTFLRKEKWIAWVNSLLEPLSSLHYDFIQKRNRDLYNLKHNGQVCYLRGALNDEFDKQLRRIQITEGNKYKRQYLYTRAEQKPKYLGTMYLRSRSDYADTGVDFIVLVPHELINKKLEVRALVDFYRLASKRYKIEEL